MKTAADIMTKNPIVLTVADSFETAVLLFLEKKITSIPILDKDNKLLGIFTEQGLIKAFVMKHTTRLGREDLGAFKTFFEEAQTMPINTPLDQVMRNLITSKIYRVLITDSSNKIIGIVSPRDIMRASQKNKVKD